MHSTAFTDKLIGSVRDGKDNYFRKDYRKMVILLHGDPQFVTKSVRPTA
ncbi:DnaA ATPase domain-containing protein [Streptomyces turgidiscabies]